MMKRFPIGLIFLSIASCSASKAETIVYQCVFNKSVTEKLGEKYLGDPTKLTYVYDSEKPNALELTGAETTRVSYHKWRDTITFFNTPDVPTELTWSIIITSIDADGRAAQSHHVMNVDKAISGFWQLYGRCSKS
jgi:hypothetical protein